MVPWIQMFLDTPAVHLDEAVTFWSAVTGWRPSERRGEDGQFLTLLPGSGPGWVKLQAVDGAGGVHLDLDSDDRPGATEAARALGATHAWTYHDVEVMRSPGGLTFCQTLVHGPTILERDGRTILDQVCIDVPPAHWTAEVDFWSGLSGRTPEVGALPEFVRLVEAGKPRILLQRTADADGPVRAHPDLATADRASDTVRHRELGAVVRAEHDFWTVLEAPGGQVYCLTDRDPGTGGRA
ncbi:VOC family protein [Nocardioides sp. J2M5]|uniref:VOC family protein n=1 Tax=Nocardioides palaemonis TaxID=2829810 RepID=UPI001BA6CA17|nr:VOC family protein [Nocardioides palaemonis]MBS2938121.1 VOC family protein [Nocardioides palaemonis]